jgi:hypothetical protein
MMTNKDYCDYETSRELKELGFVAGLGEDDCGHCLYDEAWHDQVDRPLLYEAQKWLREEKGVIVGIINNFTTQEFDYYVSTWAEDRCRGNEYTTYEHALLRGIKEAVKLLKEK